MELVEDLVLLAGRQAFAVIRYPDSHAIRLLFNRQGDHAGRLGMGDGVFHQVDQYLLDQGAIDHHQRNLAGDLGANLPAGFLRFYPRYGRTDDFLHQIGLEIELQLP